VFNQENKPLRDIIYILAITMLFLTAYSYSEIQLDFAVKVKKAPIKAFWTAPKSEPILERNLTEFLTTLSQKIRLQNPVSKIDSSSQTILLTGDSMCEGLMFRFQEYAKRNKHNLKTVIWYSSTTVRWSQSDSLRKLIQKYEPDFVFFTTGSNELFIRDIQDREKYIQNIVAQVGDKPFVWIGPPNWAEDTGINDLLIKNVGKDRFFESRYLKFERSADGAHPTFPSAAVWADTIATWVMQKSRNPILLAKPVKP
jgi:hypothetical protein